MTALPLSPRDRPTDGPVRALWLTCALDGRDHVVVEADPTTGAHLSACARTVWASSLASPPATRCPDCLEAVGGTADRRSGRSGRRRGRRAA